MARFRISMPDSLGRQSDASGSESSDRPDTTGQELRLGAAMNAVANPETVTDGEPLETTDRLVSWFECWGGVES